MRNRVRLAAAARREQLLQVGIEHFSARSYEDFSIEELAARAGVSKGLVFHYFPSKRDFYMAALRTATAEMLRLIETPPGLEAPAALAHALDAYLRYVEERAPAYRAVLRGGIGADPEVQAIADDFRDAVYERVASLVTPGHPPAPPLRSALRGWIGFVEAASLDWIDRHELPRDELAEQLARTLAAAVGVAGSPRD